MSSHKLQDVVNELGTQETSFVAGVEHDIRSHIESQSVARCLTIVTRDAAGAVQRSYAPTPPDIGYIEALIAFCRGKRLNGRELDSALTDSTVDVVVSRYESLFAKNADQLSASLSKVLLSDRVFLSAISDAVLNAYKGPVAQGMRRQIQEALLQKIQASISSQVDNQAVAALKATATKAIVTAVQAPISTQIAAIIAKFLAMHMKALLAKVLASKAFKVAIMTKIKGLVLAGVVGVIVKFVAAKLGITTGAAVAWVLIPVFVAWIGYEVVTLPKKLGEKISEKVAGELSGSFDANNLSLLEGVVAALSAEAAAMIAAEIVGLKGIEKEIADLATGKKTA